MAIKTYNGTGFVSVSAVKVKDGTEFSDVKQVNAYKDGKWQKVFPTAKQYTKTYSLSEAEIYWGTGGKETGYSSQLIVGSYGGGNQTARRSLMFFPVSTVKSDLKDAQIVSVRLYLKRLDTTHGEEDCHTCIKTHNYSSAPSRWENGTDSGNADSGTPTFARGEGKWVDLLNSVGEGLRDGSIKGLCLDADSDYTLSRYGRFERSSVKLRITYSKEE